MKLLTKPYLLTLKPSCEMNIIWIQSEKTDAFVEFGLTEDLDNRIEIQCYEIKGLRKPKADDTYEENSYAHPEVSVWQYIAKIESLEPGSTVYYRCSSGGAYTKIYFFRTAPENGEDFRFAPISDLQALHNCHKTVVFILILFCFREMQISPHGVLPNGLIWMLNGRMKNQRRLHFSLYATGKWGKTYAICTFVFLPRKP